MSWEGGHRYYAYGGLVLILNIACCQAILPPGRNETLTTTTTSSDVDTATSSAATTTTTTSTPMKTTTPKTTTTTMHMKTTPGCFVNHCETCSRESLESCDKCDIGYAMHGLSGGESDTDATTINATGVAEEQRAAVAKLPTPTLFACLPCNKTLPHCQACFNSTLCIQCMPGHSMDENGCTEDSSGRKVIVYIVAGCGAVLLLVVVGVCVCCVIRRRREASRTSVPPGREALGLATNKGDDAHEKEIPRDQILSAKTTPKARLPPVDLYTTPANGKVSSDLSPPISPINFKDIVCPPPPEDIQVSPSSSMEMSQNLSPSYENMAPSHDYENVDNINPPSASNSDYVNISKSCPQLPLMADVTMRETDRTVVPSRRITTASEDYYNHGSTEYYNCF